VPEKTVPLLAHSRRKAVFPVRSTPGAEGVVGESVHGGMWFSPRVMVLSYIGSARIHRSFHLPITCRPDVLLTGTAEILHELQRDARQTIQQIADGWASPRRAGS